jgi:protein phosphatase
MGGHARGDVAAETAARRVAEVYYNDPEMDPAQSLRRAIQTANADVFVASQNSGMEGMGTTVVALVVTGSQVTLANVGDSRAYLVSRGQALQVTRDHSVVQSLVDGGVITPEQAEQHPDRNRILRAVGVKPSVEVDVFTPAAEPGDAIVLCSDGLSILVRQEEIARVASSAPPQAAAQQLVNLANERGGYDNITAVIARVAPNAAGASRRPARASALVPILAGGLTALFLGVFAIAAFVVTQTPQPTSVALSAPTGTAVVAPTSPGLIMSPALPPATQTRVASPTLSPIPTPTRTVSPTPSPTPTQTSTRAPTPAPTIPKGEIIYEVPWGGTWTMFMNSLGIANDPHFYDRHAEIWCTPRPPSNPTCFKGGTNLILKWEELNPAVGLPAAQGQPGKMLWMAVNVNDEILRTRGLENLVPHRGNAVLVRGKWEGGAWVDDQTVHMEFVWYPQSNRYGQVGRVPPVATPMPEREPPRGIEIEPQEPPKPEPPKPEPPAPPPPP